MYWEQCPDYEPCQLYTGPLHFSGIISSVLIKVTKGNRAAVSRALMRNVLCTLAAFQLSRAQLRAICVIKFALLKGVCLFSYISGL